MNLVELYKQTPVKRHSEIIVSSDRLFFDGEEHDEVLSPKSSDLGHRTSD